MKHDEILKWLASGLHSNPVEAATAGRDSLLLLPVGALFLQAIFFPDSY